MLFFYVFFGGGGHPDLLMRGPLQGHPHVGATEGGVVGVQCLRRTPEIQAQLQAKGVSAVKLPDLQMGRERYASGRRRGESESRRRVGL